MNESDPSSSNRIIRTIVPTPTALGHTYSASQFRLMPTRPIVNQTAQSPVTATSVSSTMITSAGAAHIQVSVPLVGTNKETLSVASYTYIPKSNSTDPVGAGAPVLLNETSTEKTIPVVTTSVETLIKANVKNVGIQKVNYVKQVPLTVAKPITQAPPSRSIVQAPVKKDAEIRKPIFYGPGLRQPLKPHLHQVPKTIAPGAPRSTSIHSSLWPLSQQDTMKPAVSYVSSSDALARTKPLFQNATVAAPHEFSKKHTLSEQPKTTISITPASILPPREAVHRSTALPVAPISTGHKSFYQVLTPNLPTVQGDTIKKIPMIVSQAITTLPVSNSPSTISGFIPPGPALSSGQITVMTCGAEITYVPAPTPPNGTNTSIPIAKVYPQQQSTSRASDMSASSGRLSVPVIPSVNASSAVTRTTPALIQVGAKRSTPTTSIVTTQTTIMSTIPVAVNKSVANSGIGPVLCWPISQPLPTAASSANSRSNLSSSSAPTQTIRVQPHVGNVLLVENPKTTHLQATPGSAASVFQVADARSGSGSHSTSNQPGVVPTTPTMSPKPAILRRPRPENSSALKKLSFPAGPRRDLLTKPDERRHVPYTLTKQKIAEDTKANIPVVIQAGNNQRDENEAKPVLENQVFAKPLGPGSNITSLKLVNTIKPSPSFSNSAKDGGTQSYSIHSVADLKVKVESGYCVTKQNSVKSEPASASQMLQFHQQSMMHTYAAEGPHTISNVQHRIISQASGHHTTTHTIFTKPGSHSIYPSSQGSKLKLPQKIKSATSANTNPHTQTDSPILQSSRVSLNSFPLHRTANSLQRPVNFLSDRTPSAFDYVKKEPPQNKPMPGLEQVKQPGDGTLIQNHGLPNHLLAAISPAKSWTNTNTMDSLAGLSPRKRPRKQTHVVSEDRPVVMEDEESTDDADECEDEPMTDVALPHLNVSTTPATKLPGHKALSTHRPVKNEPYSNKKTSKEDNAHKSSHMKSEPGSSESKSVSEYTDRNGVRYVLSRKRPAVSVLNRLKPNSRSIANHFMRYTDVRVKDKKTTLSDLANEKDRLKGVKVARLAFQLQDMVECERDIWNRMQAVHDGLVKYRSSLVGDVTFETNLASPSPGTPSSLSNSFRKATPRSSRSSSMSAINENGPMQSPSTPIDRKVHKVKDEISNIEELAQANLQRCHVVSDQLGDTKTMLLKSVDHRKLVTDILESSRNQKTQMPMNTQMTKRLPKKKNTS